MGDCQPTSIRPDFNGSLHVEGRCDKMSGLAGAVLLRELDERLGLTRGLSATLIDPRDATRVRHSYGELLRSWLYTMAAARTDARAVGELRDDAVLRMATSDNRGLSMLDERASLATQPTLSRMLASLASSENLEALERGVFDSARRSVRAMHGGKKLTDVTLDIDSFPLEAHGHQPGSKHNGHYRMNCYHPLGVMLGETGHWIGMKLRAGNVHTAEGAGDMLLPLIDRTEESIAKVANVRGDAGFVGPQLLEDLELRKIRYAFRLPANDALRDIAGDYARRPPGRPPAQPRTWCYDIAYRPETWPRKRRVVLVVQEKPGELFLHTFFIVTSFTKEDLNADSVLDFYRERGTMEGHIGEHQSVLRGRLSSTNRPKTHIKHREIKERAEPIDAEAANAATLCLHAIAYNLFNTMRLLAGKSGLVDEPAGVHLRKARASLLAVPGRIVVSARRATLIVSEKTAAIWGRLWKALRRLERQPAVPLP